MRVIFNPETLAYLDDLVYLLYQKEYFGLLEASEEYVGELIDDILANLPLKPHKPAPLHFDRYGKKMKYASFRKNRHTVWYVFFKTYTQNEETFYLVRYIANNHTSAQYL